MEAVAHGLVVAASGGGATDHHGGDGEICEFVLECCKLCVDEDLAAELEYLRGHDRTVRELETWLDMRQAKLNSLIDIIVQGRGSLSQRKRGFVEELTDEEVQRIERTVARNFAGYIDKRV